MDVSLKELDKDVEKIREEPPGNTSRPDVAKSMERMLLTQSNGKLISEIVDVPELEEQVQRAVKQVEKALRAEREFREEKRDLEDVNKEQEGKR